MTNGSNFAYPIFDPEERVVYGGLTKRELFAAAAMQGMLANSAIPYDLPVEILSSWAKVNADALIAELNKPEATP